MLRASIPERPSSRGTRRLQVGLPIVWALLATLSAGCGQTLYVEGLSATPDAGGPPDPRDMARIVGPTGVFLIDRYEASIRPGSGVLGDDDQDRDDDGRWADPLTAAALAASHGITADDDEGQVGLTTAIAESVAGELPAELSYYQAAAACARAQKRLCRPAEWRAACQNGAQATRYPYGPRFDGADRAGADCWTEALAAEVQPTGTATACVTQDGVYDLSGNVEEWVDYLDPSQAVARGGATLSTADNATCGASNPHLPGAQYVRTGFRCCRDP